jgi:glycosyltransferase involved in cell wall biosynthesis
VAIVQDAIDAKKYVFNPDTRAAVRESLSLRDSFVIGHVGRFAEVKNHGFLLDVFSEVAGKRPNARLVLVGDGTLRGAMADKAEQLGLSGRVAFLGVRDDVPSLMQAFDALVLPSHYEGLPGVTTEAQAAGLPCLISDRVTRECDIVPNLCTFLPIGQGTAPWVDAITGLESAAHDMVRRNTCAEIAAAGFDSGRQAQNYAKMYLEKENGSTWTAF